MEANTADQTLDARPGLEASLALKQRAGGGHFGELNAPRHRLILLWITATVKQHHGDRPLDKFSAWLGRRPDLYLAWRAGS